MFLLKIPQWFVAKFKNKQRVKSQNKSRRIRATYLLGHSVADFNNPGIRFFNRIRG